MKKVFFFGILLCILGPMVVFADALTVKFDTSELLHGNLVTPVALTGSFSFDTLDAIRNGITARIFITFQLTRAPGFIGLGKKVFQQRQETFTLSFDVWNDRFILEDKQRKDQYNADTQSDVISHVNALISPLTFKTSSIGDSESLLIRARIKIQSIKLFPPFGIFLVFFDPWNYESNWIQSDVFTMKKQ
jgi:hypothetical protein